MMIRLRLLAACLLLAPLLSCMEEESPQVPLPALPEGPVPLRVAYVINPRMPQMSPEQIQLLLDSMRKSASEYLGITLEFSRVEVFPISDFFDRMPQNVRAIGANGIYDARHNKYSGPLEIAFGRALAAEGEPLERLIAYTRPYTGILYEDTYANLGSALAKYELQGYARWRKVSALDGQPIIDDHPYNEFVLWSAFGYGEVPYELILTNQPIASVETRQVSVHSALRGGYTNGVTTYNKDGRYGAMSVWSTYAFTANDEWTKELREGEEYTDREAALLAGLAATHEIGHQLLHLAHPYTRTSCIMYPVPKLAFRRWASGLSAKGCPIGSSKEMTPDAAEIRY